MWMFEFSLTAQDRQQLKKIIRDACLLFSLFKTCEYCTVQDHDHATPIILLSVPETVIVAA
jgi:hypothetical protein